MRSYIVDVDISNKKIHQPCDFVEETPSTMNFSRSKVIGKKFVKVYIFHRTLLYFLYIFFHPLSLVLLVFAYIYGFLSILINYR